jgi:hypothetical protein
MDGVQIVSSMNYSFLCSNYLSKTQHVLLDLVTMEKLVVANIVV